MDFSKGIIGEEKDEWRREGCYISQREKGIAAVVRKRKQFDEKVTQRTFENWKGCREAYQVKGVAGMNSGGKSDCCEQKQSRYWKDYSKGLKRLMSERGSGIKEYGKEKKKRRM